MLYLLSCKINYPNNFILLRGNHESRSITSEMTFKTECLYKYDEEVYDKFCEMFNTLPIVSIVKNGDNKIFCVHGGIGVGATLENIKEINRFVEVECDTLLNDLLWSDPVKQPIGNKDVGLWEHMKFRRSYICHPFNLSHGVSSCANDF